jgi:hypothetical protein
MHAVSMWRAVMPFMHLRQDHPIDVQWLSGTVHLKDLLLCDAVICFRPADIGMVKVLEVAKRMGKKIILDLDDDLINIRPATRRMARPKK